MAVELIDSIVDRGKVGGQIKDTTTELVALQKQLVDTAKAANDLNNVIGKSRTPRDFSRAAEQTTAAIERQNQALLRTQILQERLATTQAKREQAEARTAAVSERSANAAIKQASAYEVLSAAYKEATELARNAGARFGETSTQFTNAARSANFLRERLDAIDRPLGNYQRNVGNYRSAFDGLGNSINQLTREFPAFAVSTQTGILALSNNIPMFFDQIQRTRLEVAALRAEGQQTPGVFARLLTSFFSFGTVLSLGVTLLTIYGKEIGNFVKALFQGKDALDIFAERQKSLNDVYRASNKNIAEQLTNLKYLYAAATDVTNAEKDRLAAARELQKEFPKTFGLQKAENIINGEASAIYTQLTKDIIENARAKAAQSKITEEVSKQLDAEIQIQKIRGANQVENEKTRVQTEKNIRSAIEFENKRKGRIVSNADFEKAVQANLQRQYQTSDDRARQSIKVQEDIIKRAQINIDAVQKLGGGKTAIGNAIAGDNAPEKTKVDQSPFNDRLSIEKKNLDAILQFEGSSFEDREKALDTFENNSLAIIQTGEKAKAFTQLEAQSLTLGVTNDTQKEIYDLYKSEYDRQISAAREKDKAILDSQKESFEKTKALAASDSAARLQGIQDDRDDALLSLSQQYAKGLISKKQYEDQSKDIERQASQDSIKEQIKGIEALLLLEKKRGVDTSSDEAKLAALKRKLSKETADSQIADAERVAEREKALNDEKLNLANELADFGKTIIDRGYELQKNRIQDEITDLDTRTQAEIDSVSKSGASEQEKADKIAIINAKAAAQKANLENQQRAIQVRQAKFEKAFNIAKVVENTAVGIAKTIANLGFPLATPFVAIAAAIGAAQIASILAQPIPKYADGTKSHGGGLAIFGEAGQELIKEPGKSPYLTNGATLGYLPKGTEVISNRELMLAMGHRQPVFAGGSKVDMSEVVAAMKENTKATKSIKASSTMTGWRREVMKANNWDSYERQHFGRA